MASLRELDRDFDGPEPEQWVVLHRITRRGLQLLHWKPVASKHLAVRIEFSRGETLDIVVAVDRSDCYGALYGTSARFHPLAP